MRGPASFARSRSPRRRTASPVPRGSRPPSRSSYAQLEREGYLKGIDRDRFVDRASLFFAQWNLVHPFRDGNGRTQRLMLETLGRTAGHVLDLRSILRARMIDASVEASDPVTPSLKGLRSLISEAADPQRLATFDKMRPLLDALRRDGHFDWNEAHLSVARPGERLDGIAAPAARRRSSFALPSA